MSATATPVTATPVGGCPDPNAFQDVQQMFGAAAQAVGNVMNQFSDQIPQGQPQAQPQAQPCEGGAQPTQEEVGRAKQFLGGFINYLNNGGFRDDINATAQRYNVPPKKLAQNFLEKALGTVGDVLGVVFSTAGNAAHTLVDVLSALAHGAVNVVVGVANALARLVTLNRTCVQA